MALLCGGVGWDAAVTLAALLQALAPSGPLLGSSHSYIAWPYALLCRWAYGWSDCPLAIACMAPAEATALVQHHILAACVSECGLTDVVSPAGAEMGAADELAIAIDTAPSEALVGPAVATCLLRCARGSVAAPIAHFLAQGQRLLAALCADALWRAGVRQPVAACVRRLLSQLTARHSLPRAALDDAWRVGTLAHESARLAAA